MISYKTHNAFINSLAVSVFILLLISSSYGQRDNSKLTKKPNIILIFTDQQNSNMMSAAGNPYLNTPAMDLLAQNGVLYFPSLWPCKK